MVRNIHCTYNELFTMKINPKVSKKLFFLTSSPSQVPMSKQCFWFGSTFFLTQIQQLFTANFSSAFENVTHEREKHKEGFCT